LKHEIFNIFYKNLDWNVEMSKITIVSSFNKTGFQMNPSKVECENALHEWHGAKIISFSVLAAGYLGLSEAADL
jgi:hypothetical protein